MTMTWSFYMRALLLFSSLAERGFDPSLHFIGFLLLVLLLLLIVVSTLSYDELRSNEVLGDVSDEACDGEY
jgi:hypothetical protein